jgi:hypothetical protein
MKQETYSLVASYRSLERFYCFPLTHPSFFFAVTLERASPVFLARRTWGQKEPTLNMMRVARPGRPDDDHDTETERSQD